MEFYEWKFHKVRHLPTTFGGHRHYSSGDGFDLSRNHVFKALYDFK